MTKKEYSRALIPDKPPDEPSLDECAPFFLAKELDYLPLDAMGPIVSMRDPFNPEFEIICANPYHNNIERIGSFKQFLMGRFYSDYTDYLKAKIEDGTLDIGKRSHIVPQPDTALVSEDEVERINLYRKSAEEVYADIIMSAKIRVSSERDGTYREDRLTQWFRIRTYSDLNQEALSFNNLECIKVYDRQEPAPGTPLDEYLVPYTSKSLIDGECAGILSIYYPEALERPCRVDGRILANRMGLRVELLRLFASDGIRGQIYFEANETEILNDFGEKVLHRIPANTIVVNINACLSDDGTVSEDKLNDTIIHECYHFHRHRLFYLGQRLYNSELCCLSCTIVGQQIGAMIDSDLDLQGRTSAEEMYLAANCFDGKTPVDWMEWQSNRATPRIRMPARTTEMKINELLYQHRRRYPMITTPRLYSRVVSDLASFYGVSRQSAKQRMIELGYTEAKGVLNYVNGRYAIDYAFSPGSLGQSQTFTIDFTAAVELYQRDSNFRECIGSGLYQYIDDHFCRVDARYVYRRNGTLHLTSYAKAHMDECCLVFSLRSTGPIYLYREGTLQKEVSKADVLADFDGTGHETDFFAMAQRFSEIMSELPGSPGGTLKAHMERKRITIETLVSKTGISERTLQRLRNDPNYRTTRENAIALCIGLQLEPVFQKDLIAKLGFSFGINPTDMFYELLMVSLYKQPISVFNAQLTEHGYPPLSRCVSELDC
ncbi:MAG: helix-turn-helix transcriptional regulator [Oscillospiraceae bacterium]|nr:helix-turn-helix transcriptional regulator [Oscillospiraceae bacterium]